MITESTLRSDAPRGRGGGRSGGREHPRMVPFRSRYSAPMDHTSNRQTQSVVLQSSAPHNNARHHHFRYPSQQTTLTHISPNTSMRRTDTIFTSGTSVISNLSTVEQVTVNMATHTNVFLRWQTQSIYFPTGSKESVILLAIFNKDIFVCVPYESING